MAYDAHTPNFAYSTVLTAPSPASSGTSLVVQSGDGTKFPAASFNATIWPAGQQPTTANAEIVRVTAKSTDTFTITRTQESTSARTVVIGDQIAATQTAKIFTDIEAAAPNGAWTAYTPTWTGSGSNPTLGNGTWEAAYQTNGKLTVVRARLNIGSTTTFGTGNYSFSLPNTANENGSNFTPVGTWGARGASNNYVGFAALATTTTIQLLTISVVTASLAAGIVANNAPETWANGAVIMFKITYEST